MASRSARVGNVEEQRTGINSVFQACPAWRQGVLVADIEVLVSAPGYSIHTIDVPPVSVAGRSRVWPITPQEAPPSM